ncbi:MAG: 50S ribosomal protein L9 [Chloroflexota bacterium]|nr:50S ribosomal protein L9 [Chloroflexota bacterium]
MQVLLLKDVAGIGSAGQVKKVSDGYARNFLLPRKLAVVATEGALKQSEGIKQAALRREAKTLGEARELAGMVEQVTLTFRAKAGEGDRLFGSITTGDIADALAREKGITVDKRKIELSSPLKELGNHQVQIKLHPEVSATVMVVIEKEAA